MLRKSVSGGAVDHSEDELLELRRLLGELTARVFRIEQALMPQPGLTAEAPRIDVPPRSTAAPSSVAPPPPQIRPSLAPTPQASARKQSAPDLESRIGSHWLNRIGISAVLIGVSYFLKFAFDNNWIGPTGRVAIGLLAGIAVVLWSESFRRRGYRIFSYSLKAVGIGILYLSLYAAFQVYSLVPSGVAFVMMLAVTSATAVMAWTQDAEILAAFALIGGFVTPLLLYIGWYSSFYDRSQLRLTVGFATLFFAIFAVAPLLARQAENKARLSESIPLFLVLVNAAGYFLQIYIMYEEINSKDTAWFALALAGAYIFLSRRTRARAGSPEAARTVDLLHLALAIGFITVAIPIRLDAHWVTMGWFVETAVLLWVAERLHSEVLNVFFIGALVLGVGRLLLIDNFYITRPIFNNRMATYAVAIAVLGAVAGYGSRRKDETGRMAAVISVVALNLLALIALSREVADYYSQEMTNLRPQGQWDPSAWRDWQHVKIARDFTYSALWMAYGAMLMAVGFWRRSAFVRWQALVLIAFTIGKVFLYDVSELDRGYRIVSFIVLGALLLAISFVYQRDWLRLSGRKSPEEGSAGA